MGGDSVVAEGAGQVGHGGLVPQVVAVVGERGQRRPLDAFAAGDAEAVIEQVDRDRRRQERGAQQGRRSEGGALPGDRGEVPVAWRSPSRLLPGCTSGRVRVRTSQAGSASSKTRPRRRVTSGESYSSAMLRTPAGWNHRMFVTEHSGERCGRPRAPGRAHARVWDGVRVTRSGSFYLGPPQAKIPGRVVGRRRRCGCGFGRRTRRDPLGGAQAGSARDKQAGQPRAREGPRLAQRRRGRSDHRDRRRPSRGRRRGWAPTCPGWSRASRRSPVAGLARPCR